MPVNIQFDPTDPAFRANPYPFYHQLRAADPVHWSELGFWMITRYADAVSILQDARFGYPDRRTPEHTEYLIQQGQLSPLERLSSFWLISKNPPDHTRLRGLMNKAFTPRVVEALRPRIQTIVDGLLDTVKDKGGIDIMADLAYSLPITVIAELLGVPAQDRDRFKEWSDDLVGMIDIVPDPQRLSEGEMSVQKFFDYFRDLITERRKKPQDDLISALAVVEEQGTQLNEHELLANLVLLLAAGHETTTGLIGNAMFALLRHPDEMAKLRNDPALIRDGVEELLRYDSPVQFFGRNVLEDVTIDGKVIRKGQTIFILLGAINRDPAQFPDPDRLDITRNENRHLAFGYGIHFCLGAPLARIEGQIAIGALIQRVKNLVLDMESVKWRDSLVVRGLKALPVTFEA
jgi:pimeloyl-[acyl-carrier protein] synthase